MHLEQEAAGFRLERAVNGARRPAGVGMGTETRAAPAVPVAADDQIPGNDIHLFPVLVDEGLGRIHARLEPQVPRAKAALSSFVKEPGKHLPLRFEPGVYTTEPFV